MTTSGGFICPLGVVILVAVISQLSTEVNGLKCKVCSGNLESDCYKNASLTKFDVECDTNTEQKCETIYTIFHGNDVQDISSIRRACTRGYSEGCAVINSYLGFSDTICVCSDDLCNEGNNIVITEPMPDSGVAFTLPNLFMVVVACIITVTHM
ncbi:hypothetical protein EB796_019140 [Bugula neritina]|uniref:Uncharacterized protein n=1 Tax=Bugula neritina TaxID=10212 RepID=A0A7J7J8I2_BUGNE|nr:hypothetical protein EB796_019140 [Bugula neritina]